jgi:sodium/proline symporter
MLAEAFFIVTLLATFLASALGRRWSKGRTTDGLYNQQLNRWLIGLSAGATANSGFVVTAAVGIGYSDGLRWVMLPLAWLLGDIVFWLIFPQRINETGRRLKATTISELLTGGTSDGARSVLRIVTSLVVILSLSLYLSAQWLSGQKFLAGAFGVPSLVALALFAGLIVVYTAIGGFRGSVYADSFQAVVRLLATTVILIVAVEFARADQKTFTDNLRLAGDGFLQLFPPNLVGFVLGFACAGLGFGLGQPQIVSRYLAGANPAETQSAWWIYIGFVQFTWIGMTVFGVLLRGIMPNISDPEAGLSVFFQQHLVGIVVGVIVADIFATIAATSNSILVAISQAVTHDLISKKTDRNSESLIPFVVVAIGGATMALSLIISGAHSVLNLVLSAVAFMAAGLAAPVMVKVLNWRNSGLSLLVSCIAGLLTAVVWKYLGLSSLINEAAPGIAVGLVSHWVVIALTTGQRAERFKI